MAWLVGDHAEEDLFISQISSEVKDVGYTIWWLVGTYSLNMAILGFFSLIMWRRGPTFSPKKNPYAPFAPSFCFFFSRGCENSPKIFFKKKKKTLERERRERMTGIRSTCKLCYRCCCCNCARGRKERRKEFKGRVFSVWCVCPAGRRCHRFWIDRCRSVRKCQGSFCIGSFFLVVSQLHLCWIR